ncbi:phosphate ABC transporter substrate-binding protein, PhoT family [Cribrihabitans marinus]|uniref:Phosphate ABC transporter substrate-binding protein, PhoT family n=1 Tax=Cribrihabitans marinus TaxID=1227549 RepID=A0A1H6Y8T1_9RHOB|nr:substrate-binding domain-containing protein [Cribrihabitans marinus]GGH28791.1 OmpA family protein [Cribrihabitans marinus]SEJ37698.1 phosphate ABC transporter substrate-binding protein, PhoT family [Cribrihabitans marinus]
MAWCRAAVFAALSLFCAARPGLAEDVALTSHDGKVEITGTLLGFDGEFYRVDTKFGELTVDSSGVTCDGPGCPNLTDFVAELTFSGSSTMAEVLLPALVEGYALRNGYRTQRRSHDATHFTYRLSQPDRLSPVARFSFRVSTTDEGFADLLANEADIVMALREIRPEERRFARDAGMGDLTGPNRSRVLALDAMVPVVAPDNPIDRISTPDLARVFSGEIVNWSELGGPDAPIALHLPDAGSGLAQAVEDRLLKPAGRALAPEIRRHKRSSQLARAVTADPFAIGLASFAETGPARALTLSGACGFSLTATRRSIKTEDYPLNSPMFLYLPARRLPKIAREFLAYAVSPAAQIVIRRAGFVDQMPELIPLRAQGDRLANAIAQAGPETGLDELQRLVSVLSPMSRLTTSFRFETGSSRPDAQSRANIVQLAQALESGAHDAKTLVFVGFSDGQGPAEANARIARRRAESVRDAVLDSAETFDRGRVKIAVEAFGEALPMACDNSDWGRQVNRRVEVWIR